MAHILPPKSQADNGDRGIGDRFQHLGQRLIHTRYQVSRGEGRRGANDGIEFDSRSAFSNDAKAAFGRGDFDDRTTGGDEVRISMSKNFNQRIQAVLK